MCRSVFRRSTTLIVVVGEFCMFRKLPSKTCLVSCNANLSCSGFDCCAAVHAYQAGHVLKTMFAAVVSQQVASMFVLPLHNSAMCVRKMLCQQHHTGQHNFMSVHLHVVSCQIWLFITHPCFVQSSIVVMLVGAVIAGATDLTYSLPGYIWVTICAISTAMYLLLIRALKDSTGRATSVCIVQGCYSCCMLTLCADSAFCTRIKVIDCRCCMS